MSNYLMKKTHKMKIKIKNNKTIKKLKINKKLKI